MAASSRSVAQRAVMWFRCDLRVADNASLLAARGSAVEVLPLFVIDPRQHGPSPLGENRTGPRRRRFLREGILSLNAELQKLGSALRVEVGDPAEVLQRIGNEWNVCDVHAQRLSAWEEWEQERLVSQTQSLSLHLHDTNTLLHPDDLPFRPADIPHVFTSFRTSVEKKWKVRAPLAAPDRLATPASWGSVAVLDSALPTGKMEDDHSVAALENTLPTGKIESHDILAKGYSGDIVTALENALPTGEIEDDPREAKGFSGDRDAALARLRYYCDSPSLLGRYKQTRNGLVGSDFSSRFSLWLSTGVLSAREINRAVLDYEAKHGSNESSYWMIFELLWRDFFQFTGAKHGKDMFLKHGMGRKAVRGSWDLAKFEEWREGRTGQPFIDANMRELRATGWMSNRGRQNVASYLVHDLGLDWRMGAWYFEAALLDYDACSNWGNWQYLAGVGNDPRENRRFNPVKQAGMYDKQGTFVRLWS